MNVAIPLYDRFTALDAVGPYEVLSRIPGATVHFVAVQPGPIRAETGMFTMLAESTLDDVPHPEVIVVPGGLGNRELLSDEALLGWLREAHEHSRWTTSVCTGALLLAAAGILENLDASTHWAARDQLAALGARPVAERVVERGKIITAAGVSAGIDMALLLAARLGGDELAQAIQLGMEYDPEPPFDSGSVEKAPAHLVALVREFAAPERAVS